MPGMEDFASVEGRANYGLTVKYENGADTPSGNILMNFRLGELRLKGKAFDWLMVAGNRAQFEGTGTINGEGSYGFLITVIDDNRRGRLAEHRLRIKIWDADTGIVIYEWRSPEPLPIPSPRARHGAGDARAGQ